jgi:hypothetical protein
MTTINHDAMSFFVKTWVLRKITFIITLRIAIWTKEMGDEMNC